MTENQKHKILPLTSDVVFKRVFAKEGNEDILRALLEAILDVPIKKVVVKNPELPRNLYDSKAGILDVKAEINEDTICDVEMQVKNLKDMASRSSFYLAKILSDEVIKGERYASIKKAIAINLLNFEYYNRNSYRSIARMKFEKTKEEEYIDMGYKEEENIATQNYEMHFIELPKFIKKNPEAESKLEQWLWLIAGRREKIEMERRENKELNKAIEIIDQMSMDPKEWELYESRQRAIMDYNTGIREAKEEGKNLGLKQGLEQGEKKKQIEIAKKLIIMKMDIKDIIEVTGLTEEEIKKLQK